MRPTERLVERLRAETDLVVPDGWTFHRRYAGRWQMARGAISWWIQAGDGAEIVGSPYPVSELLRAPTLRLARATAVTEGRIPEIYPT